jgi:DNA invertase Pin-like site-specific DNA recombinase
VVSVKSAQVNKATYERRPACIEIVMGTIKVRVPGGAKGRNGRPAFDALCRDATNRQFDIVMAWNVDRLGRSLTDLLQLARVDVA